MDACAFFSKQTCLFCVNSALHVQQEVAENSKVKFVCISLKKDILGKARATSPTCDGVRPHCFRGYDYESRTNSALFFGLSYPS